MWFGFLLEQWHPAIVVRNFAISSFPQTQTLEALAEKAMAIKHLLTTIARRRPHRPPAALTVAVRSSSTSPAVAESPLAPSLPSPPPPSAMIYDRLAEDVKLKIRRLENPDPRFLKYGSPHPSIADHTHILTAPETRVTTLPNGLRVATESNLAAQTATVGVWIDAGSRFENDATNGTAHFLEHMIFKGTDQRTARQLEEEVENMGGHLNAYTSREQTTYYAKVLQSDVPKALSILADILQNSKFDDNRILREREVILREMEEVEKQPDEVIFDHLHATAFQYSPLARTILGPANNIKTISKEHLQSYIKTHYTAPRMVIAASGAVRHEDIVETVKGLFTKLSGDPTTASQLVAKEPSFFTGSEVRMFDSDLPLAHFAVAFNGASWTDPDSIPLMVMQAMLGSWNKNAGGGKHMGSELAQRVAINDIADSYMAFNTNYKDTGLFGVFATAKPDCLDDLAYSIMYEITKLVYRVSEADVIRARNQLKSSLLLHLDGTSAVAEDIGRQLLTYGRRIPLAELFARIDAVNASTIKRVANRFIYDRDIAIASMGPVGELPDYNWFRRRTYWNRY
ncbi:probable mitochondrial-processing peptidase subunit beta, mitochondrial [Prunus avium]|uniref:mitochondrial processing peptidase n=1 Tax=Prunus avium TaxID=42229 RepID=A0A6P5RXC5_PRUAV|nr:probable mitochondrial-processing peptidase subunit beta, mitochondrial [Prunus avium]